MPEHSDVDHDDRTWSPAFPAALVESARALLSERAVLVISGPDATERDLLADDVAALPTGPAPTRHEGRHGEGTVPYFALAQLSPDAHPPLPADAGAVEDLVRRGLEGSERPVPVVLTDAELCDAESVEVLVRLAVAGDIRLVATVAPTALDHHPVLRSIGALVEVPALDAGAVADLVAAGLGVTPDPELTDLVLRRSGGSRELVRHLVETSVAAGLLADDGEVLRIDPAGRAAAADAPPGLLWPTDGGGDGDGAPEEVGPDVADLVDVASLLEQLDLVEAHACFGDRAIDVAAARGVLRTVDGGLAFAFRAEQVLVQRSLSGARRIELFEQYAARLGRSVDRYGTAVAAADWWRAAGHLLPCDLAARAARESNLRGQYRRAVVYTDPDHNDEHVLVAPVERGFALNELGESREFLELFSGVDPRRLTEDELYPYFRGLRVVEEAPERERLERLALATDDPAERRSREGVRLLADLVHQTSVRGDERVVNRLRSLAFSGQLSSGNRAVCFTALSSALRHAGRPAEALQASEFALQILVDDRETVCAYHLDNARELHIMALMSALDLAGASQALTAYGAGQHPGERTGRIVLALGAFVSMHRGDLEQALARAELCVAIMGTRDPHEVRGWVEAMAAECLVHLGRHDEAVGAIEQATLHPSRLPQVDLRRRMTLAATRDALAEPEEALEILDEVIEEAESRELQLPRIEAAAAAVLVGGPPQLGRLLRAVEHLVDPIGTPLIWQRFARAADAYDIRAIVELAGELEACDALLTAAGVAQFVLDMARRATDLDAATREHLTALADLSGGALDGHRA